MYHSKTTNLMFNGLPTQATPSMPLSTKILKSLEEMFNSYQVKHNKAFFYRFDLNFPQNIKYEEDNRYINHFLANYKMKLNRWKIKRIPKPLDASILWVREKNIDEYGNSPLNHHYHLLVLTNGSHVQSAHNLLRAAAEVWEKYVLRIPESSGLVNFCQTDKFGNPQKNGIQIRRGDNDALAQAFHWGSYLAKIPTKGHSPKCLNEFGCSYVN